MKGTIAPVLAAIADLALAPSAKAQQIPSVAILSPAAPALGQPFIDSFRAGLRELG